MELKRNVLESNKTYTIRIRKRKSYEIINLINEINNLIRLYSRLKKYYWVLGEVLYGCKNQ